MTPTAVIRDSPAPVLPGRRPEGWRSPRRRLAAGVLVAVVAGILVAGWRMSVVTPEVREAREWLTEYQALRMAGGEPHLPEKALGPGAQQVLVDLLVQPESRLARGWDQLCRRLPRALSDRIPRLPRARDRVMSVGPALIELPGTLDLRRRLLEAALKPGAANQMFAIQIANGGWPIQPELVPLLERLSEVEDPHLRMRAASMLQGVSPADTRVERLLARLREDAVSVVREAARPRGKPGSDTE